MESSPLTKLDHIGFVVSDLDKAIEHFQALGMGPFRHPSEVHNAVIIETREGGKPIHHKSRIALGKMGPTMLQLIQPLEGEAGVMKFLKATGGGFHHIAFAVDDVMKEETVMEAKGFKQVHQAIFKDGKSGCMLFESPDGRATIELVQWPDVRT